MSQTVEKKQDTRNAVFRVFLAACALALQIWWLYAQISKLTAHFSGAAPIVSGVSVLIALIIYGRHMNAAMKLVWIFLVLAFPFFGVPFYVLVGLNTSTRHMRQRYEKIDRVLSRYMKQDPEVFLSLERADRQAANQFRSLKDYCGFPAFRNTDVDYFDNASDAFEAQLEELRRAREFIFMEYHAIEQKQAFSRLHAVLRERAAAGVEVRIFYDEVGSMGFIDRDFIGRMKKDGIRCRVFNPVVPVLNLFMNNRDHRKITVIDGKTAFTGGYNLADEYFNITHPYGHWLDTGVRIRGDAVRSMTAIFLENWNAIRHDDTDDADPSRYLALRPYTSLEKGWCQPYADSPLDEEHTGENVYMNLVNSAEHYVWFITPYLLITDEMSRILGLAAKRGVDVRIITPGIPDKKFVYCATRSYYAYLVRRGVRIFEYTPGFCHAKQAVSDDKIAVCGTINLDYRSLYHHFENGVLMYDFQAVRDMRHMFEDTFPVCREVTEKYKKRPHAIRIGHGLLRLISPML